MHFAINLHGPGGRTQHLQPSLLRASADVGQPERMDCQTEIVRAKAARRSLGEGGLAKQARSCQDKLEIIRLSNLSLSGGETAFDMS